MGLATEAWLFCRRKVCFSKYILKRKGFIHNNLLASFRKGLNLALLSNGFRLSYYNLCPEKSEKLLFSQSHLLERFCLTAGLSVGVLRALMFLSGCRYCIGEIVSFQQSVVKILELEFLFQIIYFQIDK